MPRPRAGDWLEDEAVSWRGQGLDAVASLLEDSEISELGLGEESKACEQAGLRFYRFPIPDRSVHESEKMVSEFVLILVTLMRAGNRIGIHCRMGVGRSAMMAVCVLWALGMPLDQTWFVVQKSWGLTIPNTQEQRD